MERECQELLEALERKTGTELDMSAEDVELLAELACELGPTVPEESGGDA